MTNKSLRLLTRPALVILLVCLCASVSRATTVVMPTDLDLIIGARGIVRGKVVSINAAFDDKTGLVSTYVKLSVRQVLKGDIAPGELILKEPGGQTGTRVSVVFGAPQFEIGEPVLVYLDTWPDGSLRVHEMLLGKFSISRDSRTGHLFVVRNTQGSHVEVLPNPASAGPGQTTGPGGPATEQITSRMELSAYMAMVS